MPEPALPPADTHALELVRDYRQLLTVRLYSNAVNRDQQRTPASYTQPVFPGYQPRDGILWQADELGPEGLEVRLRAVITFTRLETGAAATVRGWYLAILLANGTTALIADGAAPQVLTLAEAGQSVALTLDLSVQRYGGVGGFDVVAAEGHLTFVASGEVKMQFKGRDRKLLTDLQKALDAIHARDARWTTRSDQSKMASVQIFPAADAALQADVAAIESRIEELKLA